MANFKTSPADPQAEQWHIWNGSQHRKVQDHDQQNQQHQSRCQHTWPEVRACDQFQVPGATLGKDGTCSAEMFIGLPKQWEQWPERTSGSTTPSARQASSSFTGLQSPPSYSVAVKHRPCLLTPKKGSGQTFAGKCVGELLHTSYFEHRTNHWVESKINFPVGPQAFLLTTVKRWKLAWFRNVTCHNSLSKIILHVGGWARMEDGQQQWRMGNDSGGWVMMVEDGQGCCGPQRKCRMDNIKEWTALPMLELLTSSTCRNITQIFSQPIHQSAA